MNKKTIHMLFISSLTVFYSIDAFARAGGGGRHSGNGSLVGAVIVGLIFGVYKIRRIKMIAKAKTDLEKAKSLDATWDLVLLKKMASKCFYAYQIAWSNKDLNSVKHLLDPEYLIESEAQMSVILNGQINIIQNPVIEDLNLISVKDVVGQESDMFVLEIQAKMIDYTVSEKDKSFIESTMIIGKYESHDNYVKRAQTTQISFKEYWVFKRRDQEWLLWDIKQIESFVSDLKNMTQDDIRSILKSEEKSADVNDEYFYRKGG